MNWEKLKFLRFETTRIGVFVQFGLNWWNWLVRLTYLIIILYYLPCVIINLLGFVKLGFSNFSFFDENSILKLILWFWSKIELILTTLEHASSVNDVHASYRIDISIFFCANLLSALSFSFLLFLSLLCLSFWSIASCLGRLELIGPPFLLLPPPLIVRGSRERKTRKHMRCLTLRETFGLRERFY